MSRISGRILLLWIGGFIVVLALAFIPTPPQAKLYPDFWTDSPAPNGIKGFYTLMAKQDTPVEIWKKPVQILPLDNKRSLMVMVEPSVEFEKEDIGRWQAWIENGNTLWLLIDDPDATLPFTGFLGSLESLESLESSGSSGSSGSQKEAPDDLTGEESPPDATTESLIGGLEAIAETQVKGFGELAGEYSVIVKSPERLRTETTDQVLLADEQGVVAFARHYGDGELIVCQGAVWVQNQHILQGDHLRVLLAFMERGSFQRIMFNEYVHGQVESAAFWGAFPLWMLVLALAGCLWLIFELWRRGMRFGAAEIPREDLIRLPDERIRALAAWYEQQGFYAESLAIQADFLLQSLSERWGVAAEKDELRLENILRRKLKQQEIGEWLEVYHRLSPNSPTGLPAAPSQRDFVAWSRRLSMMQNILRSEK